MYICICKSVTDGQIRKAVQEQGVRNMRGLCQELGACNQCGKCAREAKQLMRECLQEQQTLEMSALAVS
jgi:bacterioferritin-associated ferredoxin